MCAKYLFNLHGTKKGWSSKFSEAGYKLLVKKREQEGENKQDEKELLYYRDNAYFKIFLIILIMKAFTH